jgi:hypothetical protein
VAIKNTTMEGQARFQILLNETSGIVDGVLSGLLFTEKIYAKHGRRKGKRKERILHD